MKIKLHEAEEGGYWAEIPSLPGCATQGETLEETIQKFMRGDGRLPVNLGFAPLNSFLPSIRVPVVTMDW